MKRVKSKRFIAKIAAILIVALCFNNMAAIVSDNDGSAFITKAEFESLKADFDQQIESYQKSIDNKVDGAIAAYLAGLMVGSTGYFTPNIRDLEDVKWRDKLIRIGKVRTWTTGTNYTDSDDKFVWVATYDTILKAGANAAPTSQADTDNCSLIWVANGTFGHGGWILSMQADFKGNGYWIKSQWGQANTNYNVPNYPMIRYRKNSFEKTVEKKQTLAGWFDYGTCFTNAFSGYSDTSVGKDGQALRTSTNAGGASLYSAKYAADVGPGRDSNCWGIAMGSTAAAAKTSTLGWRPTKESTIFFATSANYNGSGRMHQALNCTGYKKLPLGIPFPVISENESWGKVTDDNLHTLMLGSTNDQEVNYYVDRDDFSFWDTRPDWPLDCYVTATLSNIKIKKVGINQQPSETGTGGDPGGPWDGDRGEDRMNNDSYAYKYCHNIIGVPDELVVSIPSKPHKQLKLLDSNFISKDETRYITFGEGLCVTESCPDTAVVTLKFELNTNAEFDTNKCKATIELCDKNFNNTEGATFYDVDSGATRLSPTSTKWVLDTTKVNTIKLSVKKGKALYVRFSPNDNNGKNYVSVKKFHASYLHE